MESDVCAESFGQASLYAAHLLGYISTFHFPTLHVRINAVNFKMGVSACAVLFLTDWHPQKNKKQNFVEILIIFSVV